MAVGQEEIERRIAAFAEACRQAEVRMTHQRMEIFKEIAKTDEHPDAETLYIRVRRRIPVISLDTLYRTLTMLEKLGVYPECTHYATGQDLMRLPPRTITSCAPNAECFEIFYLLKRMNCEYLMMFNPGDV